MYKKMMRALAVSCAVVMATGCVGQGNRMDVTPSETAATAESKETAATAGSRETDAGKAEESSPETSQHTAGGDSQASAGAGKMNLDFSPEFNRSGGQYEPLSFAANAPAYKLNGDLSNVENLNQFGNLTEEQRGMIAANGFVVIPTNSEQLFYIYEENTYKKVPSFVTTDSVLQLYHIFYDYSLRNLETDFLYSDLSRLNGSMIGQLMDMYEKVEEPQVKEAARTMLGYFGVACLALEEPLPAGYPAELAKLAEQERDLIVDAGGVGVSPLFGYDVDYSLFKARGHYTRSEELGRYFRAMSWYGIMPMPFYNQDKTRDEQSAMRAIVASIALCRAPKEEGIRLWENIYSTTSFFVGDSDDITPCEIAAAVAKVYSDTPDMEKIPQGLAAFYREVDQLRSPDIVHKVEGEVTQLQMRFMGQRYIPDSEILQELTEPDKRPFPSGLDVMAVFGSPRAEEVLEEFYQPESQWDGYRAAFERLCGKFRNQTIAQQTDNLYRGWLYCLKSLTERVGDGYPLFMQSRAWEDKALSTALGSWSELRHDTILYGKQSGTECGGNEPPEILGYVEPNPEFFNRLLWLTAVTRENLADKGLLNEKLQYKYEQFESMLEFLRDCALKELAGEDLTAEEHMTLLTYGGFLEYLSSSIAEADGWYLVESDTDKNMAVIADVHTSDGAYLEAGVGTAAEMYVAVSQYGRVYLTRGAVFDYYEFVSEERLTDEEWQEQVRQSAPERPPFTGSYMDGTVGEEIPVPAEPYSSGC